MWVAVGKELPYQREQPTCISDDTFTVVVKKSKLIDCGREGGGRRREEEGGGRRTGFDYDDL